LKFLTQDLRTPKIVYNGFSVGNERGSLWGGFCGMRGRNRSLPGYWSGCGL
jgi:hypothetical protein